jgi:DNA-binding response OmpR family regulator
MPKTIYIIDDDLGLQTVLSIALKDAGYQVQVASDGEEGIEQLQSVRADLVLCDVMMPYVDGVQVFETIKEYLRNEGIPIIVMTALNRKPWFSELEAEGAVILQKPFDVDHLISVVRMLLDE